MTPFFHILFDFDGVIVNTFDLAYGIMRTGNPRLTKTHYRQMFDGNFYDSYKKNAQVEKEISIKDFFVQYKKSMMNILPATDMPDVLKKLSKKHKLFIVSSTPSPLIKAYLKKYHLLKYFTEIYGADIAIHKTDKIKTIIKKYHTTPAHCIFITDTLGDIKEAGAVHVQSLAVTWGYHSKTTLKKGNHCIFPPMDI